MSTADEKMEKSIKAIQGLLEVGKGSAHTVHLYNEQEEYYEEMVGTLQYNGPRKVAEAAAELMKEKKGMQILDVGAGTGLVGIELAKLGFKNVDAVDPAAGLLEVAKKRGIYRNYMCQYVGPDRVAVDDNTYDMAVACGIFQENHIPLEGVKEFIRVVKPGGYVVITFREGGAKAPWYRDGLEPYMANLERDGAWTLQSRTIYPDYIEGEDGILAIYKIS